jgi:hypothetical protein
MNPVDMTEDWSKELLLSEAATLMDRLMASWPDLVIDDITQTGIRAMEYGDGKIKTGSVGWHITVGSIDMGIAKQVTIDFPIKQGRLISPSKGRAPNGEEVNLSPVPFSNWVRLGIS